MSNFGENKNSDVINNSSSAVVDEKANPRWDALWGAGLNMGDHFDRRGISPALQLEISSGTIPNGRAFVPGCGRGYDVFALASDKRLAVGMDLSNLAVDAANEYYKTIPEDKRPLESQFEIRAGNFFELDESDDSKFDFVYDYTFLCALDPSIRRDWAIKMSNLVRPGGELLTIIFPIHDKEGGPPFKVSLELVRDLLVPVGFEPFKLEMLPAELCHEDRVGRSGIGRWRRL